MAQDGEVIGARALDGAAEGSSLGGPPPFPRGHEEEEEKEAVVGSPREADSPLVDSGRQAANAAAKAPPARGLDRRHLVAAACAVSGVLLAAILWAGLGQLGPVAEERADVPSPRTMWSARSPGQLKDWRAFHELLSREAAALEPPAAGGRGQVVLVGDSLTESWRGTSVGSPTKRARGVPEVLADTLAVFWPSPMVLAIAGDQTQHVLWRLANGELSPVLASELRVAFVLNIGTNNLGAGHLPGETHAGIVAVARAILGGSRGQLLLSALLPRGDGAPILKRLCPPRCRNNGEPFTSFMPAIRRVNSLLDTSARDLELEYPGRVAYVDCGQPFLDGRTEVKLELMPDRLHPNAAGHRLFAQCLNNALQKLMP